MFNPGPIPCRSSSVCGWNEHQHSQWSHPAQSEDTWICRLQDPPWYGRCWPRNHQHFSSFLDPFNTGPLLFGSHESNITIHSTSEFFVAVSSPHLWISLRGNVPVCVRSQLLWGNCGVVWLRCRCLVLTCLCLCLLHHLFHWTQSLPPPQVLF